MIGLGKVQRRHAAVFVASTVLSAAATVFALTSGRETRIRTCEWSNRKIECARVVTPEILFEQTPDAAVEQARRAEAPLPVWTLQAVDRQGLHLVVDASVYRDCTVRDTQITQLGTRLWIVSRSRKIDEANCAHAYVGRWQTVRVPLAPGFYDYDWNLDGQSIDAGRVAVSY